MLITMLAGVVGTGIGGIIGVCLGSSNRRWIGVMLSLASGVMLAVVFFDLLPEAMSMAGDNVIVLLGVIWGVLILVIANKCVDARLCKIETASILSSKNIREEEKRKLHSAGLFLVLAIALHNIPEGIAIGATEFVVDGAGVALAIIIMIHNIPEGISIAMPLVASGMKKVYAIILSVIAGAMTIVGGAIGAMLGGFGCTITAFMLAFAGGAMLQVTLCDMIPNSTDLIRSNSSGLYVLFGLIIGFVVNTLL